MKVLAGTPPSQLPDYRNQDYPGMFNVGGGLLTPLQDDQLASVPAGIAREQWDDYKARFMDLEDLLLEQTHYQNPALVQQTIDEALPYVDAAIDMGRQSQMRRLEALGQDRLTGLEQTRLDQQWDSERALARVDAANRIRQNIASRSRNIAFGGVGRASAIESLEGS